MKIYWKEKSVLFNFALSLSNQTIDHGPKKVANESRKLEKTFSPQFDFETNVTIVDNFERCRKEFDWKNKTIFSPFILIFMFSDYWNNDNRFECLRIFSRIAWRILVQHPLCKNIVQIFKQQCRRCCSAKRRPNSNHAGPADVRKKNERKLLIPKSKKKLTIHSYFAILYALFNYISNIYHVCFN